MELKDSGSAYQYDTGILDKIILNGIESSILYASTGEHSM